MKIENYFSNINALVLLVLWLHFHIKQKSHLENYHDALILHEGWDTQL